MTSPPTAPVALDVESIAAGGDGVARHEGLVVFVPRTAPGDRVTATLEPGRRFARARVCGVTTPAATRVAPACAHYEGDRCGGCQLQHLAIEAQREAKRAIVRDTMRRIGHRTIELPPLRAAGSPWRYRERLSLALRRRADGSWYAGLHAWDAPDRVFELLDCRITDERVVARWREVLAASAHLPDAPALRGTVRCAGGRSAFVLEGAAQWPGAEAFAAQLPGFDGVWWVPAGGRRRRVSPASAGGAPAPLASFSQVNSAVAGELRAHVEALVMATRPAHVVDAYAGAGELAARLHAAGIRVTAIELDHDASAHGASRLTRPSRAITARVEDALPGVLPADVVVLNPPRAGVDARVTAALDARDDAGPARGAARIIYVSCDPATLARDVARLASWDVTSVVAFDMFPQTAHVETVVELSRRRA
jgi:23S rRNA (uracil1939-C5)-methyltransferase